MCFIGCHGTHIPLYSHLILQTNSVVMHQVNLTVLIGIINAGANTGSGMMYRFKDEPSYHISQEKDEDTAYVTFI